MELIFRSTKELESYHGPTGNWEDKTKKEVSDTIGKELISLFPLNFLESKGIIEGDESKAFFSKHDKATRTKRNK